MGGSAVRFAVMANTSFLAISDLPLGEELTGAAERVTIVIDNDYGTRS
jgi:hypothetical protein